MFPYINLHQNQRYRCSIEIEGTTIIFLLSVDCLCVLKDRLDKNNFQFGAPFLLAPKAFADPGYY
jgi:hypothetical protein